MKENIRLAIEIIVLIATLATGFHFITGLEVRIAVLENNIGIVNGFDGKVEDFLIQHKPEK